MSTLEINKFAGAVLLVALVLTVIGVIGNALVHPKREGASAVKIAAAPAEQAPKAKAAPEKPLPVLLAAADVAKGKKIFAKCKACHNAAKGAGTKIGPDLWNVVGADRARRKEFSYSSAMKDKGGKWTYENLNAFLTSPRKAVPGTKMTFAGLRKAQERADVIAYLRTLNDSPPPLPAAPEAGSH